MKSSNKKNRRKGKKRSCNKQLKRKKQLKKKITFIISSAAVTLILVLGIYLLQSVNNSGVKSDNVYASAESQNIDSAEGSAVAASSGSEGSDITASPNAGSGKTVYLTFDDGPSSSVTPQILDILNSYKIKATFFVLGQEAERRPEVLKRIYNDGHKIANHSYSHNYKHIYSSVETLLNEIEQTNNIINDSLGFYYGNTVFRFPGGSFEKADCFKNSVKEMGFRYIDWNCLGSDAVSGTKTADEILGSVINTSIDKNPLVVLLHDTNAKQTTADALPSIIEYLINQGYEFKTVENN